MRGSKLDWACEDQKTCILQFVGPVPPGCPPEYYNLDNDASAADIDHGWDCLRPSGHPANDVPAMIDQLILIFDYFLDYCIAIE